MGRGGFRLRGVFHACCAALCCACVAVCAGCNRDASAALGVDVPLAGPEGAQGILALQAVRLALDEHARDAHGSIALDVRDASAGGFQDPHEDEGSGSWRNPAHAAQNVHLLAANPKVVAVLGGFNEAIAQAEEPPAQRAAVPIIFVNRTAPLGATEERQFEAAYRARYGEAPDPVAARYYAATNAILECVASSREQVAKCLRKGTSWNR